MNEQAGKADGPPAGLSGTFALGGELNVRRLGFGAMGCGAKSKRFAPANSQSFVDHRSGGIAGQWILAGC